MLHAYYTWDGLEPDKWASVWLMKRHIDPQSEVTIVPVGAVMRNAVALDIPGAKYKRMHGLSTFELLSSEFLRTDDVALVRMGEWTSQPLIDT